MDPSGLLAGQIASEAYRLINPNAGLTDLPLAQLQSK